MENSSEVSDDENFEPTPKKIKTEWSKSYSNKAMQMMRKMGYENDKGLGKQNQGRLEPIVAVQQDGRRGLGLKLDSVQSSADQWDFSVEDLALPEKFTWLVNEDEESYQMDDMKPWIRIAPRKNTIDDETLFCDPEILKQVLEAKTVFDELNDNDLRRARSRCNPFETIRSSIFLNRAAVKMANMDSMCDYMFTNPRDKLGNSLVADNELLYFADICAGPGGFSEYVLYRKSWEAKGFGFTLTGANDFKLDKFFAGSPESFDPFYGINNDGNIFDEGNQDSLADYVCKHVNAGVHFVMADGGFSVEGQENIQEVLSKQLYLCQCLTALKILRENGSFVCKLFDLFTPFSVGLVYLMYKCFDQIAIIKPNSSRPANSERYLVCKWKRRETDEICSYLNLVNNILNESQNDDSDICELVNHDLLMQDEHFIQYITDSNNTIGAYQVIGLRKITTFCRNTQLKETRQSEFRKRCLELWNLPDKLRQAPEIKSTDKLLEEILGSWLNEKDLLHQMPKELCSILSLQAHIESIYDWHFVPIGRGETNINACSMFLCRSKGNLMRLTDSKKWEPVEYFFEVSPRSLFYGEIVYEYSGEGRTQTRVCGLHIIDAIMLGGVDIRRLKLCERMKMCEKYAMSVNKPFKDCKSGSIRSKKLYKLEHLNDFFGEMRHYTLKDNSQRLGFSWEMDRKFFVPGGILIFCEICHNFFSKMSSRHKMLYYFDKTKNVSYYMEGMPVEVQNILHASFRNSFSHRLLWKWTNPMQVQENSGGDMEKSNNLLYRDDLQNFIQNKKA